MMFKERRCFFWIGAALMVLFFYGHGFGYDVKDINGRSRDYLLTA